MRNNPGPPMTLANLRSNGVHAVTATCANCDRSADVNVDTLPDTIPVPEAGRRLRCSQCGGKTISTRPAWHTARRQGVPSSGPAGHLLPEGEGVERLNPIAADFRKRFKLVAAAHYPPGEPPGFSAHLRRPAAANQCGRRRSSQSRARSRKRRKGGMSSAKSMRPSGNIQRPKTGRMARNPPMISNMPAGRRAQREAGFLSHRVIACIRLGRRRRSRLNRRSGWA
jgi:hypothetical protein